MERKLMFELLKWKDKNGRKPLLLEGAWQDCTADNEQKNQTKNVEKFLLHLSL